MSNFSKITLLSFILAIHRRTIEAIGQQPKKPYILHFVAIKDGWVLEKYHDGSNTIEVHKDERLASPRYSQLVSTSEQEIARYSHYQCATLSIALALYGDLDQDALF